jgi:signal transduction histidine kinase/ligand-binding sensor domain-containing protein
MHFVGLIDARLDRYDWLVYRRKVRKARSSRKWQAIGLLALAAANSGTAQPRISHSEGASYGVDFWREPEGFGQSRVRAIVQTRDGYIWLGTDGGLVRFNGESFTVFNVQTGSLKDNEVWALQEDANGGLWIGTYSGGLTLLQNGRFQTFTTANGLPDDVILSLATDHQGNIWIVTPRGLGRGSHGVFSSIPAAVRQPELRPTSVCSSRDGVLVATRQGVYRVAGDRLSPAPIALDLDRGQPGNLLCGSDGALWIAYSNGVMEQRKDGASTRYADSGSGQTSRLYEDPQGGIWAIQGKRITKLRNGRFETIPVEAGARDLGSVYALCMDREGGVWLGLQSNGLARLRTRQLSTISVEDGLPDDRTRAVFEDSRGDLWIGTADGLARYREGRFTAWVEADGSRLGDIRSIAEDAGGQIWISSGKQLMTLRNGRPVPAPNWVPSAEIEAIYKDPSGGMWIGTDGAGLFQYSAGRFRNYRTDDGLGSNQVRAIMADRTGALWISTFGSGLTKYANGKFSIVGTSSGLAGDRVVAIHEDEEGALWFATRRGLSRLKDGAFFTWTSQSGLFTDLVYAVVDDGKGNFWFSSALGLFKVTKEELRKVAAGTLKKVTSVAYGEKDGMKSKAGNLGNQPVAWKTRGGQLLFTSMKGLVVVEPEKILPNTSYVPPVYIEKVIVNKKELSPDRYIELPAGGGDVEIHYAALTYSTHEKVRFRYKLEGFDPDWIDAAGRHFTYYANLGPGSYTFRVIAGKVDGAWNETGATFPFYLKPPFYRTWAFVAVVALSVASLAALLYWMRVRGLRARYSAVLAERNRISRDIHDTLSQNLAGIALQLDAVHMHLPDVRSELRERLDEACNLTRYSLAEARRAISDLRSDELEGPELAAALPDIAQRLAAALQTRIEVIGAPRKLNPTIERDLLRIFQEALTNSVKHAHASTVYVELKFSPHTIALTVRDDGRGFDPDSLSPAGSGHYGLIGMRERAERIGGHLTLNTRPGEGTELLVEVPI